MSYTTGVPSNLDDFLAALVAFAVANAGFTNLGAVTTSAGTGSRTIQRIQKGGIVWNFTRNTAGTDVQACMSYTALASGFAMTNSGIAVGASNSQQYWTEMNTWAQTGPYTGHYFFSDGTVVHAVIEVIAGVFNHISFGSITKAGSWTGGEYLTAGWHDSLNVSYTPNRYRDSISTNYTDSFYSVRPFDAENNDAANNRFSYMRTASTSSVADFGRFGPVATGASQAPVVGFVGASVSSALTLYGSLLRDSPSLSTGRTAMFPGVIRIRDAASGLLRVAGTVPRISLLKMSGDMNPKDIVNTDWQIFPVTCRTGGNPVLSSTSYEYALAYRRV